MCPRPPSEEELRTLGEELSLALTDREIAVFREAIENRLDAYRTVEAIEPEVALGGDDVRERSAGRRIGRGDDPHNAWVSRCEIRGGDGPLGGMEIAIKDSICVAGVPMTCGSAVLAGYTPEVDATIVTRLLEAGATIIGKTNMDDMAMSISGHSAFGPVLHPENDAFLAGGSSGGSAVVVATGDVDAAIGTDQGGSIRIPAAYCGIVGLKPTFGLVPYSGSVGLEHMLDHPGPMAGDVETVGRVLEAIAGETPYDARQRTVAEPVDYVDRLPGDPSDLTIGILEEGFEIPNGDDRVLETAQAAVDDLEEAGSVVEEISIPMHEFAGAIHSVVGAEGLLAATRGEGQGHGVRELYNLSWIDAFGKFRRAHGGAFPAPFKLGLLTGAYMNERYHSRYYARGMNLVLDLRNRYDEAFEEVDLLAMPTVAATAPRHHPDDDALERLEREGPITNTPGFNRTGHPAISVPAGTAGGLPVGLMLVGERDADAIVLEGASALESVRAG